MKDANGVPSIVATFVPAAVDASEVVAALVRSARCDRLFAHCSAAATPTMEACFAALQQADVLLTRVHGVIAEISSLEKHGIHCVCAPHAEDGITLAITVAQQPCRSQFQVHLHLSGAYPLGGLQLNQINVMYGKVRAELARCSPLPF